MNKKYLKPSTYIIILSKELMAGVTAGGLGIPISGYIEPENSDAKPMLDWEESEQSYINYHYSVWE